MENMWTAPRYLGRLLTKIGYFSPLDSAKSDPDPPLHEAQALVREACNNFRKYAQEQHLASGPRQPGSKRFFEPNPSAYSFPVAYPFSFRDTWGEYRPGGRYHHAVDIFAGEGTPVYAITAGIIHQLVYWDNAGLTLLLKGDDGRGYGYMHLQRYAQGITEGETVRAGELIAYVGHTGIRRDSPHLHLQVYADHHFCNDILLNPYPLLVHLCNGIGVIDLFQSKIARLQISHGGDHKVGTVGVVGAIAHSDQ